MQQILPSALPWPIAFAHRGARAHAPENTLPAFELALRLGANGLESDAWVTRDGVVVLDHDGVVRRRGRKVRFSDVDAADLPGSVPHLTRLLDLCDAGIHVSLDVKDPTAFDAILDVVAAAALPPGHLWLCGEQDGRAVEWARRSAGANVVDSCRLQRMKGGPERHVAALAEAGVRALNMHESDWTGGLVALAHRFGVLAFAWDAQRAHRVSELVRMGMDAVYSDHVDVMVASYAAELGGVPPRATGAD